MRCANCLISRPVPPATQLSIARDLGLSQGTVSRALNHDRRIPEATRRQILDYAKKVGYRRDPEISKLMTRLRAGRRRSEAGQVRIIDFHDLARRPNDELWWIRQVVAGFEAAAESEGYACSMTSFRSGQDDMGKLEKRFYHQGVDGLLLLPTGPNPEPQTDFEKFSVVWIGAQTRTQRFHQVYSDHYHGMVLCLENALRICQGKIGAILPQRSSRGVLNRWLAAYYLRQREFPKRLVDPLLSDFSDPQSLIAWRQRTQAEAIVILDGDSHPEVFDCLEKNGSPRSPVHLLDLSRPPGATHPGIDQKPSEIGAAAAATLMQLIYRGERGPPQTPRSTSILGVWKD